MEGDIQNGVKIARRPHECEYICQLQVIADVANDFVGAFEERTWFFRLALGMRSAPYF